MTVVVDWAVGALSPGEACLMGVLQGLTEFLPVSSSGHLALLQRAVSPLPAVEKVAIDAALHLGTLAAVVVYFRRDLMALMGSSGAAGSGEPPRKWIGLLAIATVPAGLVGLLFRHRIEAAFDSLPAIGLCFLLTGTLLFLGSAVAGTYRSAGQLGVGDAIVVGCFQALALMPGVSRSGATIVGGLFRHVNGDVAARFAFLLGIPAILGAVGAESSVLMRLDWALYGPLLTGVIVAAGTGLVAIALLLRLLRQGRLRWFAYYCWALGALVLGRAALTGAA